MRPYGWLTLAGAMFVVCGSLVPFRFESIPAADVAGRFARELWSHTAIESRSDFVANVLLMIPVAFCAAGIRRPASRAHAALIVLAVAAGGAALSLTMEFVQTFLPDRVVSARDVVAETAGSLIGAIVWMCAGPGVTDRVRRALAGREKLSVGERVLAAYAVLVAMWQLAPLDLSLEPSMLFHKYRDGTLVVAGLRDAATAYLVPLYIPIGAAAALFWRPAGHRRALLSAMAIGACGVCAMESSHLVVESRSIDLTALLAGLIGMAAGVLLIRSTSAGKPAAPMPSAFGPVLWCLCWAGVIVWVQWSPFNFVSDSRKVLAGVEKLLSWSSVSGRRADAATAFFMTLPLGIGLRRAVGAASRVRASVAAAAILAAGALWCGIELGVALLPGRVPDFSQVFGGAAAAAAGLWLGGAFPVLSEIRL